MIRKVTICRLRGVAEGELDGLTPLTVLVGPNGSGKSTILDALLIGARPNPAEAIVRTILRHGCASRWLLWKAGADGDTSITVESDTGASRTCILRLAPQGIDYHVVLPNHETRGGTVSVTANGRGSYTGDVRVPIDGIAGVGLVESWDRYHQRSLHELYTQTVEQGRKSEAVGVLDELLTDFENVEILTEGDTPVVHVVFADHSVPAAVAGDGVHFLLRQSLELAARADGVVLIEEAEAHMHPAGICQSARVMFAAVRRGIQIVVSTYSLEFIDALLSEAKSDEHLRQLSVYGLSLKQGRLIADRTLGPDVAFARTEIADDLR